MNAKPFLDTNVLIYAFTAGDPRVETADALLSGGGIISVQILNEFVNVSRKKLKRDWSEIEESLDAIATLLDPPLPLTAEMHTKAVEISKRYHFGFYDGMLVAAALRAGCKVLYTEDLHHGQTIEGLTIRNPFTS